MNNKKIIEAVLLAGVLGIMVQIAFAQTTGIISNTTTTSSTDTTPPSTPILFSPITSTSTILISWASSTDNVGVYGYKVYRNDVLIGNTKELSYLDTVGLYAGISYTYSVIAYDTSSNISLRSVGVTAMISPSQTAPLEVPPPVISLVRVENIIGSGAQVKWTTDKPALSSVLYSTSTNGTAGTLISHDTSCQIDLSTTNHCVNLSGLLPGLVYYKVESKYSDSSTNSSVSDMRYFSVPTPYVAPDTSATSAAISTTTATTTSTSISTTTTVIDVATTTTTTDIGVFNTKPPVLTTEPLLPPPAIVLTKPLSTTTLVSLYPANNPQTTNRNPIKKTLESGHIELPTVKSRSLATRIENIEKASLTTKKPLISLSVSPNKVSRKTEVYVNLPKSVKSAELRLAKDVTDESLYLGQAKIDIENDRFVFLWDSTQTPDGVYNLFLIAIMEDGRTFRGTRLPVTVANESLAQTINTQVETIGSPVVDITLSGIPEKSLESISQKKPEIQTEIIISEIRENHRIREEQIKNELVTAIGKFSEENEIDNDELEKVILEKSKEIRSAVDSGNIERKQEIIMEIVNSAGSVSQENKELFSKEVEKSVAKLEEVLVEQKSGVVDTKNFSVDTIKVAEVATKIDGTETAKKIEFKGKAIPNSFATLYIFSIPIVVTVKTDSDGYWNYTLDKELEDGNHQVYVGITDVKGNVVVKSKPLPFIKVARAVSAAEEEEVVLALEPQATPSLFGGSYFYAILSIIIILLIGLLIWIGIKRSKISV